MLQSQNSPRDMSQCVYCGASHEPMKPKDIKTGTFFAPRWLLAAVCVDSVACAQRTQGPRRGHRCEVARSPLHRHRRRPPGPRLH
jgi:hypothetical protein